MHTDAADWHTSIRHELKRLAVKTTRWDRFTLIDIHAPAPYRPAPATRTPRLLDERAA